MHKQHSYNTTSKPTRHLSVRIVLVTLIYSILIALCVSAVQVYIAYQQSVQNAKEHLQQIETSYLPDLISGLWAVDKTRIDTLLNGIAQLPHVGTVKLTDDTSQVRTLNQEYQNQAIAEYSYPLVYREGSFSYPLGLLKVELSNHEIVRDILDKSISIAITTLATLLLGSLFVLFIFQRWVSRHLQKMADFAEQLDINNLDNQLLLDRKTTSYSDELELVINSINHMQTTLKDDFEKRRLIEIELVKHQENLAELVSARTAELTVKTAQLEQQSLELERQNRELDAYAHSVAHDLKTPLTTIVGMSGLLNSTAINLSPEQTRDSIAVIYRTAKKMSSIIDALLLLASVRRADEIIPTIVRLKNLAEEACQRLEPLREQHAATIEFIGEWPCAMGYAQWIEEIWVNYISNAIKYGGTPPRIEIGCQKIEGDMVKCWVRDHGEGIAIARRPELFVQFSRLDPHSSEGHGLGLSIVKRIVHRLHGEVGYEAAHDGGSVFWFSLPAIKAVN